ncbi:Adherence factor [Yarrowia sp. C11]|nr:Adherence factor [Yarrowia sp. C11]KAG5370822.1 Adherence factor [Yarrowia sp. E02]
MHPYYPPHDGYANTNSYEEAPRLPLPRLHKHDDHMHTVMNTDRPSLKRSADQLDHAGQLATAAATDTPRYYKAHSSIALVTDVNRDAEGNPIGPPPTPSANGSQTPPLVLPLTLSLPPLAVAVPPNMQVMRSANSDRPKKKSKYSSEQDEIILSMKKAGKGWHEIGEAAHCDNALAARNRYQVLMGQQGSGSVYWDTEDNMGLKALLDDGERAKWEFVAAELSKIRRKNITSPVVRAKVRDMLFKNSILFKVVFENRDGHFGDTCIQPSGPPSATSASAVSSSLSSLSTSMPAPYAQPYYPEYYYDEQHVQQSVQSVQNVQQAVVQNVQQNVYAQAAAQAQSQAQNTQPMEDYSQYHKAYAFRR